MELPSSLIDRKGYIERIKPFIRKGIAKVLTGQRRVGKSFLLFQLIRHIRQEEPDASIIYVNMEDFAFSGIRTAEDLHDYISSHLCDGGYNYIFIDGIQEVSQFEKAVRSLLLSPMNDIYLTGSNARMLSGELATYLSGRYVAFDVYSLSYSEFLEFHRLDDSDASLQKYIRYGGLPYLVNLQLEDDIVDEYLKSVYSTIVFRDVVSRYNLRSSDFLERLVRFLADNTGSLFSAKSISDYLKSQHTNISVNQIQNYTEYLCNAFLIHRVERYDLVGKRIFEIGWKFYFENSGIRNTIVGYRISDRAKLLENLVFNHLLYRNYKVRVGYAGAQEIDFICEKDHELTYIQVSLRIDDEETARREAGNLLKIKDNYPKIIVTGDPCKGVSYEGIRIVPVRKFLMEF